MAVIVRNCGCGCDLRTGVIIIALFYMAVTSFGIHYGSMFTVNTLKHLRLNVKSLDAVPLKVRQHWDGIINFSIAAAVINGIDLLSSVIHLIGAINKTRSICLAWVGFRILLMLISLAYLIFLVSIWTALLSASWIYILGFVLSFYCLSVVYSYAELIKEEEQDGGKPVQGNVQDNVMFVAYPVSTGYEYGQPQAYAEKTTNVI